VWSTGLCGRQVNGIAKRGVTWLITGDKGTLGDEEGRKIQIMMKKAASLIHCPTHLLPSKRNAEDRPGK